MSSDSDSDMGTPMQSLQLNRKTISTQKPKSSLNLEQSRKPLPTFNYFYDDEREVIQFKLQLQVLSVRDLIEQGIQVLNNEHNKHLINDYQRYNLYAAKKSGKKKSDLPSLDYTQQLEKTKFEAFCIMPKPNCQVVQKKVDFQQKPSVAQITSPTKSDSKAESTDRRKSRGNALASYPYYLEATQIMPQRASSKRSIPPEPSFGCLCFGRRSN